MCVCVCVYIHVTFYTLFALRSLYQSFQFPEKRNEFTLHFPLHLSSVRVAEFYWHRTVSGGHIAAGLFLCACPLRHTCAEYVLFPASVVSLRHVDHVTEQ